VAVIDVVCAFAAGENDFEASGFADRSGSAFTGGGNSLEQKAGEIVVEMLWTLEDLQISRSPDLQISRSPDLQISRSPDLQISSIEDRHLLEEMTHPPIGFVVIVVQACTFCSWFRSRKWRSRCCMPLKALMISLRQAGIKRPFPFGYDRRTKR
jgi:hypothetical protein